MNLKGELTTAWGDGDHTFRLTISGALELEEKCKAPIAVIAQRLNTGQYAVSDVKETLRIGLIGGGKTPVEALQLVRQYVDGRPLVESYAIARLVIGGLMFGFATSPLATAAGEEESPNGSTPPKSTPPPPSSDLPTG